MIVNIKFLTFTQVNSSDMINNLMQSCTLKFKKIFVVIIWVKEIKFKYCFALF